MKNLRSFTLRTVTLFAFAGLLTVLGCGDDTGLGSRYPVTGTVTYKGAPLAKGSINFVADDPAGRGATGVIKDGKYSLTTQTPDDGALAGSYGVTIVDIEVDLSAAKAETEAKAKKAGIDAPVSGMVDQASQAKALASAKSNIPPKYQTPQTSGLKATVKSGSNKIDFTLTDE